MNEVDIDALILLLESKFKTSDTQDLEKDAFNTGLEEAIATIRGIQLGDTVNAEDF